MTARGVLVAGTSSDAGKSLVVTGICRALARRGVSVAPFKAQNMSNNSAVCADGSEIGRAQYLQARAAGVEPSSLLNPVLLKPGSDRRSFVVVRGRPAGTLEAGEYATGRAHLAAAAFEAYEELAAGHDVIVCEGAGSPAEINLRSGDYVNLGLARRFGLPVSVVGDIDRGGVFASLYGTVSLLAPGDRRLVTTFLINKFRGDASVLAPGLTELTRRTGVPFAGVLPWLPGLWLDGEDTLEVGRWRREQAAPGGLRIAVVRFPRVSNVTDVDALAAEPGVEVVVTADPTVVAGADLVVLPGSRSTVGDLAWLHDRGLAAVIIERARTGAPVVGICGGFQMLAETIDDEVESGVGTVSGLALLPVRVRFESDKVLARPHGTWNGHEVASYEIHHGIATVAAGAEPFLDGCRRGNVWGTMWHGTFENDDFRRGFLTEVAGLAGSAWTPDPAASAYAQRRETMIDTLADAVDAHLDLDAVLAPVPVPLAPTPVSSFPEPVEGPPGSATIAVRVIGIGSGRVDHLTGEAIAAMREVDVFLVADKGGAEHDLAQLRRELCAAVIEGDRYRFVEVADPPRDRSTPAYGEAVRDWHARRADTYAAAVAEQLPAGGTVGFLVWGDPSLYDSTLRVVDDLVGRGLVGEHRVVPGISSPQLLAAAHRIVLNRIGQPVHVTTGRRLLAEYTPDLGDVVVMLDGELACADLVPLHPDLELFWGAQLGLPDETLLAGRLTDVIDDVRRLRAGIRERRGWVMDTYLLRRPGTITP